MRVLSVNVGRPREVVWKGATVSTGIFKQTVEGGVRVETLNLAGDQQADLTVHGGFEKAVYAYPSEHYEYWRRELPEVVFSWGHFGENLTTEGLRETDLHIGDRLRAGSAVLVVTQPRIPCYKLALRFQRDDMIQRFLESGRSGFYFSVAEPGEVNAGAEIEVLHRDPSQVAVRDLLRLYLGQERDPGLFERTVKVAALPESWRAWLVKRAQARSAPGGS